jgi:mono/diheme cytochrome c family protein
LSGRIILLVVVGIFTLGAPGLAAQKGDPGQGKPLYVEYCLQCHGGRGEGWGWSNKIPPPPVPVPDLSDPKLMKQLSDQYLFDIIKMGGEGVGKTRLMPPAGRVMTDGEIWDVVAYLRSLTRRAHESKQNKR